jgi:hypothetical protein
MTASARGSLRLARPTSASPLVSPAGSLMRSQRASRIAGESVSPPASANVAQSRISPSSSRCEPRQCCDRGGVVVVAPEKRSRSREANVSVPVFGQLQQRSDAPVVPRVAKRVRDRD